jgi:hypothetical protein
MNPLLVEPSEGQTKLVEAVAVGYSLASRWPVFQYVEAMLFNDHKLEARDVLLTCPRVGISGGVGHYGWFRLSNPTLIAPQPGDTVALTIAGCNLAAQLRDRVKLFLLALGYLVEQQRQFVPSPVSPVEIVVTSEELRQAMFHRVQPPRNLTPAWLEILADQFEHEPSTWTSQLQRQENSVWSMHLSPQLRRYEGVPDIADYLERLFEQISPPITAPLPPIPSGLALPEAIDYLNAIWRLHRSDHDEPLFRIGRAEAAAKLAMECSDPDDFFAGLSALTSIIDHVALPDGRGSKLVDLRDYLFDRLEEESRGRVEAAIDDLRAMFDLRVWREHEGTHDRMRRGARRLGVSLPAPDWGVAWAIIQARCVAALHALREELERA